MGNCHDLRGNWISLFTTGYDCVAILAGVEMFAVLEELYYGGDIHHDSGGLGKLHHVSGQSACPKLRQPVKNWLQDRLFPEILSNQR